MGVGWLANLNGSLMKVPPIGRVGILIAIIMALYTIPATKPFAIWFAVLVFLDALVVGLHQ